MVNKNNGKVYMSESIRKQFPPGSVIELPDQHGVMKSFKIDDVIVMDHEEYAMFRENLTVALQQVMDAPVVHEMPEHRKKERKNKEIYSLKSKLLLNDWT